MEPLDSPPMSGSNSICVATVLLETNIIPITSQVMNLTLESPGGLIKIKAHCEGNKVNKVQITNLPSFVQHLDKEINVEGIGNITVSIAYGGDSFVLVENKNHNVNLINKIKKNHYDALVVAVAHNVFKEMSIKDLLSFLKTIPFW